MKIIVLLTALFFALPAFSQQVSFADSISTVLWGIVNTKGDTSYLLGTCHIVGNTFIDGFAPIKSKYQQANCVVVESIDDRFPAEKSDWFTTLAIKDRHRIKRYLKQTTPSFYLKSCIKMPAARFYYLLLGEMALRECHTYKDNDVCSMDEYVANGAITFGKKLYGLEQRDDQFDTALFAHTGVRNTDDAIAKIKDFTANSERYKDTVHKFCDCLEMTDYLKLKINYRFSKSSVEEDSTNVVVCDQRNDRWMPGLKNIIDSNNAFIAVGLGHLYYNKGLIAQLINSGYTLFPVAMQNMGPVVYSKRKKR